MEKSIVMIHKNDLLVGTSEIAKGFDTEHRYIKSLVDKYKNEFEEWGEVFVAGLQKPTNKKGGRPLDEYLLNEPQTVYLATLMSNTDKVRKFKHLLTKEFFKQRKLLNSIIIQKQNVEWLDKRESGKIERRIETEAIKEFVEYAKTQGSKSADKYYMIITKMQNQSLVNIELIQQRFENVREVLSGMDLDMMKMADHMISICLREGMKLGKFYKDIYQDAKLRIETFAISMGKTPIRMLLDKK